MTSKQEQLTRLEERLRDGFLRIGEAMNHGIEVENWERHFANLVREYEQLSDDLAAHHAEAISDVLAAAVPEQVELVGMPRQEVAA